MSTSTDAILAFGWDLGEASNLELEWIKDDEEYGTDYADQFEWRLLEHLDGFTERWEPGKDKEYFTRKNDAKKRLGVEIIHHCTGDYPMLFLAALGSETRAWRGEPQKIKNLDEQPSWREDLEDAAKVLELKDLGEPSWQIFSMWG